MSRNPNMGLSGNSSPNTIDDRWGIIQESLDQVADKEALNIINTNKDFDKSLDRAMDEQSGYAKELFGQMIKEGVPEEEARKKIKEYFVINEAIWHQSRIDRHGKVLDYHERQNTKFNVAREVFERDNAQMLRNYGDAKRLVDGINSGGTSLRDMSSADRYRYENALRKIQSIESEINGMYSGYDLKVAKSALDRANIVIDDSANIDSLDGRRVNSVDSGTLTKSEKDYTHVLQKKPKANFANPGMNGDLAGGDVFARRRVPVDAYDKNKYSSQSEADFYKAVNSGVKGEELSKLFAEFSKEVLNTKNSDGQVPSELIDAMNTARSALMEINKQEGDVSADADLEKTQEKQTLKDRFKKIGKKVVDFFKRNKRDVIVGSTAMVTGAAVATIAVGGVSVDAQQPADKTINDGGQYQIGQVSNHAQTKAASAFAEFAAMPGRTEENGAFNTDNAAEIQKGPEAREKLADNGQYDRAADPYFAHHKSVENMFGNNEVKESLESYGPDMANLTPEEFKAKFLSEDNPAGIQQILMTNQEVAGAFGLDYQSSEALFDAYRNGDQAAFAKVAEIRKAIAEHFTQEGVGSLEGVQFDSVYLQDINGDGSDLNFAHADNLNIGGTTRIVSFIINGNKYTIETRDQCGGQIVLRDGTLIKLPPEITRIDGPTPPNTPPNEERETPPVKEEVPPTTPPTAPPYTPPYTPPIAPPPGVSEDFKFDTDQTIYGYGGSVMKEERGNLTEELTFEEERDQATFDITHMLEDIKIKSEDNDSEESHSDTIDNPIVSNGDTTDEARRIIEETQKRIQDEEEAKRREQEERGQTTTLDGEQFTRDEIERIQNGGQ